MSTNLLSFFEKFFTTSSQPITGEIIYFSPPIVILYFCITIKTVLERWFLFDDDGTREEEKTTPETQKKDNSPINLNILNSYTDGDEEQNKMLLKSFYEKSMKDLELLSRYIIDGESEEWSRHSHSLKGASSYVGAETLYELAEESQEMKIATKKQRKDKLDKMVNSYEEILKHLKITNYY